MAGGTSYQSDRQWADGYTAQVLQILRAECASLFVEFVLADDAADLKRATDIVFTVRTVGAGDVAVRVRSDGRDFRDVTLRSRRLDPMTGQEVTTELAKIRAGHARWYLYCWTATGNGKIVDHVLVDLDRVRACGLLDRPRRQYPNDDGVTWFIAINLNELRQAGCIVLDRVASDCPPPRYQQPQTAANWEPIRSRKPLPEPGTRQGDLFAFARWIDEEEKNS